MKLTHEQIDFLASLSRKERLILASIIDDIEIIYLDEESVPGAIAKFNNWLVNFIA